MKLNIVMDTNNDFSANLKRVTKASCVRCSSANTTWSLSANPNGFAAAKKKNHIVNFHNKQIRTNQNKQ